MQTFEKVHLFITASLHHCIIDHHEMIEHQRYFEMRLRKTGT